MRFPEHHGGVIHVYQKYNPLRFPSPTKPPPDLASAAVNHMLTFGTLRQLSDEELAQAVELDPSMIAGLGPSLESLMEMLRQRKAKILATYEVESVHALAARRYRELGSTLRPPQKLARRYERAYREEQIYELERLWYLCENENSEFAAQVLHLVQYLGDKYLIDELAAKYHFTGQRPMTIPEALEIKDLLETIDRLLEQLQEATKNARLAVIDIEALQRFVEEEDIERLKGFMRQIEDLIRQIAEQQGLAQTENGYQLTPKAYRLFQGRLLEKIFSQLQAARSGRHAGPVVGEGNIELTQTKSYEFGDSLAHMDIPATMINAMIRQGPSIPISIQPADIVIHRTRNVPKCATVALLDMSGSMRYGGLYIDVKRMGLALDGLIRKEYPGDFLEFVEIYTFARRVHPSEIPSLMPKSVTLYDPVVRLRADMSDPRITEMDVPWHFTNIQRGLQVARQLLSQQDTANRQIILITDGLPTAHFEDNYLYLMYPPHDRTEEATLREGLLCAREGIVINIFLLPGWTQSHEDVRFAYNLAETTRGRVFFTAGKDLDRYVVWDYLERRRDIIG
jgi:uncharacterized protein with von Willebrand factor type A (vWA) domain